MKKYVDSCRTYEILLQDSGLLPKPTESWIVFVPEAGMLAHVDDDGSDYEFDGTSWIKVESQDQHYKPAGRPRNLAESSK